MFPLLESQNRQDSLIELYTICHLISNRKSSMSLIVDLGYEDLVGELFSDESFEKFLGIMECVSQFLVIIR